jgi:hypothetical protein
MRFSLKWALAAMAYIALAAAALASPHWAYADLLWGTAVIIFGYATLLALFSRGKPRARATGFAVFAACYLCAV